MPWDLTSFKRHIICSFWSCFCSLLYVYKNSTHGSCTSKANTYMSLYMLFNSSSGFRIDSWLVSSHVLTTDSQICQLKRSYHDANVGQCKHSRLHLNLHCRGDTRILSNHKVMWKFIVENALWRGGFWERLIRSIVLK